MTSLHLLNDCAEIDKILNAMLKSLSTNHSPLATTDHFDIAIARMDSSTTSRKTIQARER